MAKKFFSYNPDDGFEKHETEERAKASAQKALARYRKEADDEWPDEVEHVYWGEIRQRTVEVDTTAETGQDFETCDYQLADA